MEPDYSFSKKIRLREGQNEAIPLLHHLAIIKLIINRELIEADFFLRI
jgi:hypothetical protein